MNIYVGNLSYEMSEEQLRSFFEDFGEVSTVSIVKDRETGHSRGFGFVEMPSAIEARAAIEQLNGKDVGGRNLVVNEARPKPAGGGGGGGGGRGFGGGGGGGGRGGDRPRGGHGGGGRHGGGGGGGGRGFGGGGGGGGGRGGNRF